MRSVVAAIAADLAGIVDNVVYFDCIDSTHRFALRLFDQLEEEGTPLAPTLILAQRQTAGVGRGARSWQSPRGGLYLSLLRSDVERGALSRLPMLAAVAALAAVERCGVQGVGIKWPNDIVVAGGKIAGILVHGRAGAPSRVAVGLGVNLDTAPALDEQATLPAAALSGHLPDAEFGSLVRPLAVDFVAGLHRSLADPLPVIEIWRQRLIHHAGAEMTVRLSNGETETGTYVGLTDDGFLQLDTAAGTRVISGGDVIESARGIDPEARNR